MLFFRHQLQLVHWIPFLPIFSNLVLTRFFLSPLSSIFPSQKAFSLTASKLLLLHHFTRNILYLMMTYPATVLFPTSILFPKFLNESFIHVSLIICNLSLLSVRFNLLTINSIQMKLHCFASTMTSFSQSINRKFLFLSYLTCQLH